MKKHKFTDTHVEIHDDGSASIHHMHKDGPTHDVKHAVMDLDGLHDCLEGHCNPEETEEKVKAAGKDPEALEEKVSPGIHDKVAALAAKGE
jgi:hypothetical protein